MFVTQMAAFMFNGSLVPLYDTLGQTAVEYIIRQSKSIFLTEFYYSSRKYFS